MRAKRSRGRQLYFFSESELYQHPDGDPVHIELMPLQPVPCRTRMSMMIVMPAFAEGEQGYEPIVGGIVSRLEGPLPVHVRERIDEPCRVPPDDDAGEDAPDHPLPSPDEKQQGPGYHERQPVEP